MRIPLNIGAYEARSIIASAQRAVNLYPELNPADSPVKMTHYTSPGLVTIRVAPVPGYGRALYRASDGTGYACIGSNVYRIESNFTYTLLGTLANYGTPVTMQDNGLALVIVDGTPNGYAIDMTAGTYGAITGAAFYGADRVDFLDTYFLLNKPSTNIFYISLSNVDYTMLTGGTAFDPVDFAAKVGYPDPINTLIVMHREAWMIGTQTCEVYYNSGAADFTFQQLPGSFVEHGCVAKYSVAKQDLMIYWLGQDAQGKAIVFKGAGYKAIRISTHALEQEIGSYSTISDAVSYTYQQDGHSFYVLNFPSADKTWVWDEATQLWHERAWLDSNGNLRRHRAQCAANIYGKNVCLDWETGTLYEFDLNAYTDAGNPIPRIRSFPHILDDGKRVRHTSFIADLQVGTLPETLQQDEPKLTLRWSDTRGASWSDGIMQGMGSSGEYLRSIQFNRLGIARDRVYELSWSVPTKTALNGAFLQTQTLGT